MTVFKGWGDGPNTTQLHLTNYQASAVSMRHLHDPHSQLLSKTAHTCCLTYTTPTCGRMPSRTLAKSSTMNGLHSTVVNPMRWYAITSASVQLPEGATPRRNKQTSHGKIQQHAEAFHRTPNPPPPHRETAVATSAHDAVNPSTAGHQQQGVCTTNDGPGYTKASIQPVMATMGMLKPSPINFLHTSSPLTCRICMSMRMASNGRGRSSTAAPGGFRKLPAARVRVILGVRSAVDDAAHKQHKHPTGAAKLDGLHSRALSRTTPTNTASKHSV